VEEAKHFIGGEWTASSNGETIPVIDPSDGQPFATLARGTAADIDIAVQSARRAYEGAWGAVSAAERGRLLYRLSMLVAACHEELAATRPRLRATSSSMQAPPTSCTAKRCPIRTATRSSRSASPMA
jgi:aldehyde dehydrogenase (NAD+)